MKKAHLAKYVTVRS